MKYSFPSCVAMSRKKPVYTRLVYGYNMNYHDRIPYHQ